MKTAIFILVLAFACIIPAIGDDDANSEPIYALVRVDMEDHVIEKLDPNGAAVWQVNSFMPGARHAFHADYEGNVLTQEYLPDQRKRTLTKISSSGQRLWDLTLWVSGVLISGEPWTHDSDCYDIAFDAANNAYVSTHDGYLHKISSSGQEIWRHSMGRIGWAVDVANNHVYIGGNNGGANTWYGDATWIQKLTLGGQVVQTINIDNCSLYRLAVDAEENYYVGNGASDVRKYDQNWNLLWVNGANSPSWVETLVVGPAGNVYLRAGGRAIKLSGATGNTIWAVEPFDGHEVRDMAVDRDGNAYVASLNFSGGEAALKKLSSSDGQHVWTRSTGHYGYSNVSVRPYEAHDARLPIVIEPSTPWITDTRAEDTPGHDRKQYFRGQKIRFPFKIRNDADEDVLARVRAYVAQRTGDAQHGGEVELTQTVPAPGNVILTAGSETNVVFEWTVPTNAEFGFYDAKAIVELASSSSVVLDTTEGWDDPEGSPSDTNRYSDAAWVGDALTFDGGTCTSPLAAHDPLQSSFMVCKDRPVVFVPGISGEGGDPTDPEDTDGFAKLPHLLTSRELRAVRVFDYDAESEPGGGEAIERLAARLGGASVDFPARENSIDWTQSFFNLPPTASRRKVDCVGHSMGGLLIRCYRDGLATSGKGYEDDIDRIITVASPLWGAHSWTGIPLDVVYSLDQRRQMAYGSDLLWALNPTQASPLPNHTAFAVEGDEVVQVDSACAPNLAQHCFVIDDEQGIGEPDHTQVIKIQTPDHPGYRVIKAALAGEAVPSEVATPFSAYPIHHAMVFYRVNDASTGARLPVAFAQFVRMYSPSTGQPVWWGQVTPEEGAGFDSLYSETHIKARPGGRWALRKDPVAVSIPLVLGTLLKLELQVSDMQDTDGDRLSDEWEREFWPEDGLSDHHADEDADNDGFNNFAEQILGSNPADATSVFQPVVLGLAEATAPAMMMTNGLHAFAQNFSTQTFSMQVYALPGCRYDLETSTTLLPESWSVVDSVTMGDDEAGDRILTDPSVNEPKKFFRIRVSFPFDQ